MLITTKAEYIWSTKQNKYLLVTRQSINWTKSVGLCKGASSAQSNLANQQSQFYNTLTSDYSQQFANQSNILGSLQKSLSPILAGGPNQFGYSTAQTNNLNSSAIQNTAQGYANASQALKQNQAAAGGGNTLLPNGAQSAQQGALASAAANNQSNQLLGIQQAGYQQGLQNFNNAVGQLGGVASQYNPTGFAGSANSAGGAAFNSATQVQQMNNQASPWNLVGGILGGVASGLTGGLTGLAGSALSGLGGGGGAAAGSADYLGNLQGGQAQTTSYQMPSNYQITP